MGGPAAQMSIGDFMGSNDTKKKCWFGDLISLGLLFSYGLALRVKNGTQNNCFLKDAVHQKSQVAF